MKIAAHIKGCYQVGVNLWQDYTKTYIFDDSATIAQILKATEQRDICSCNLSNVEEVENEK
jgi:hypothetical protein